MTTLLISDKGAGLGIGWKLVQEGFNVQLFLRDGNPYAGSGIFHRVESWRKALTKTDMAFADAPGMGQYEEVFKRAGVHTFGISQISDEINGPKQGDFLRLSQLPVDEDPTESVIISGFFNGRNWVSPFFLSIKNTHLFAGELGPLTDCMGCMTFPLQQKSGGIIDYMYQITPMLRLAEVKTFISVGVSLEGVYGIFCGLNFDIAEAIFEGAKESTSDILYGIASGSKQSIDMTRDCLIAVRMTAPPWPYQLPFSPTPGLEISGLQPENLSHVYLTDVCLEDEVYKVVMDSGIILKATARGRSIQEARQRVYTTLKNIDVFSKQYRLDIGSTANATLGKFREAGLINGVQY